jgi:hypothetical protein
MDGPMHEIYADINETETAEGLLSILARAWDGESRFATLGTMYHFVWMVNSPRGSPLNSWPQIRSLSPLPYTYAVSNQLVQFLRRIDQASTTPGSWSGDQGHVGLSPQLQAPKFMTGTWMSPSAPWGVIHMLFSGTKDIGRSDLRPSEGWVRRFGLGSCGCHL